jgi:hypothetical protein
MTDILERLLVDSYVIPAVTRLEAAAEIRRLRSLVAQLEQSAQEAWAQAAANSTAASYQELGRALDGSK